METEEAQLLRTIRAFPHDDTARLVYADWLEERGHCEQAEFIRVQCVLDAIEPGDPRQAALGERERRLWAMHASRFRSGLPARLRRCPFERGFAHPTGPAWSVEELLAYPAREFESAPLWSAHLTLAPNAPMSGLNKSRRLRSISRLHLNIEQAESKQVMEFFADESLVHLRTLVIAGRPFDVEGVQAVAAAPALRDLRRLGINCRPIGPEGASALSNSPYLTKLEALDLFGCGIGDAGLRTLSTSPNLHRLRELNLTQNGLDDDAAWAIIVSRHFKQLVALRLYGNHLGDAGASALAHGRNLGHLAALDLGLNRIGPAGGRALADSPYLLHLRQLYLGGNRVGEDPIAIDALKTRFGERVTI